MRNRTSAVLCGSIVLTLGASAYARDPGAPPATETAPSIPSSGQSAPPGDPASRAREAFSDGLRWVEAGEYARARAAFERAYELQPHPLALYNIGQCQARLGQYTQAIQTLQRFLEQSGASVDPDQQSAVTRQIAELRARMDEEKTQVAEPAPTTPRPPAVPVPTGTVPALSTPPAPAVVEREPPPSEPPATPRQAATTQNTPAWAWWLGGSGIALLGSAAGLYLWNDGRHEAWKTDRAELDAVSNLDVRVQQDAALWDRAHASNERLASIQRVDVSSAVTAGVGAVAIGLGIWQLLAADAPSAGAQSQASAAPLAWRMTW